MAVSETCQTCDRMLEEFVTGPVHVRKWGCVCALGYAVWRVCVCVKKKEERRKKKKERGQEQEQGQEGKN